MGRSPCCDKIGLKKGPWTPEEDQKLLAYIDEHGHGSWRALPAKAGLQRCGKSCRLRWTNYLRPDIKRGKFSLQEEQTIIQLHALLGNRWAAIATHLPKRTDNEIKNYWNTHLKKRLTKMGIDPVTHKPKNDTLISSDGQNKNTANLSHMAQWESARLEAEARLARQSKIRQTIPQTGPVQKPTGPAQCLDVWNGSVWSNASGDLQSPTSTISSAAGIGGGSDGGMMKEEGEEDQWKEMEYPVQIQSAWQPDPIENFTDLLLSNSSDGGETGGTAGGSGGDYWNNILNLVDVSQSDSPMF